MVGPTDGGARDRPPARRIDMEALVGWVLLVGLLSSVTLITAGVTWRWAATGTLRLDYTLPATDVGAFLLADLRQITARSTGPRRLIDLGIGVLLLTPYVRVLASMLYFALIARDRTYTVFTAAVLAALTFSLFR